MNAAEVLTPAELSVCLAYARSDVPQKALARQRFVSVNTLRGQLRSAFRKLGVGSRQELRDVLGVALPGGGS